jgi:hypothetical protein
MAKETKMLWVVVGVVAAVLVGDWLWERYRRSRGQWIELNLPADLVFESESQYISYMLLHRMPLEDDHLHIHQWNELDEGTVLCRFSYYRGEGMEAMLETGFSDIIVINRPRPYVARIEWVDRVTFSTAHEALLEASAKKLEADELVYNYSYVLDSDGMNASLHIMAHILLYNATGMEVGRYTLRDGYHLLIATELADA